MQQIFWASKVVKINLKLGCWDTNTTRLVTCKAFPKAWSGLCLLSAKKQHSSPVVCSILLGIILKDKRQVHQASSALPRKRVILLSLLLLGLHTSLNIVGQGMTVLRLRYLVNSAMRSGLCSAVQIWHQALCYLLTEMAPYVGDRDNRLSIDRFCQVCTNLAPWQWVLAELVIDVLDLLVSCILLLSAKSKGQSDAISDLSLFYDVCWLSCQC